MTLAELLISAELNPDVLPEEGKYLAQDKQSDAVYMYTGKPKLHNGDTFFMSTEWAQYVDFKNSGYIELEQLASDWETPLSIESYTAAWNAAHNVTVKEEENVICENVESEWPRVMQGVCSNQVVEFTGLTSGTVIIRGDKAFNDFVGSYSDDWAECNNPEYWKPYVQATQPPSAALPDVPATLTAQDIVKRLEELKSGIQATEVIKDTLVKEYAELRDTLSELI